MAQGDSQKGEASPGLQGVDLSERDRLLEEVFEVLNHPEHGGQSEEFDRDWIFSNWSFGLGIDPNG